MLVRRPPAQQIEDQPLFDRIREAVERDQCVTAWEQHVLALHYSLDDMNHPLQRWPLCFTTRFTTDRARLTLTTGLNHQFKFVYAVRIPLDAIEFDPEGGARFDAKLKDDAFVWELQTGTVVSTEEYTKLPVQTDASSVRLA
ncbi:hypothetical protein [Rhizobium sp. BK376]|uniref:hypothetical protein n=1 Tax=Rhizobium sp. BK376 TaxID=2512149 RepID=UPI00104E4B2D|nr:hypothetical protein [Rhizobium sp. BK376]TCR81531.1 hypothetical protein EV561_112103 [Rhizobium sp. BK376]